MKQNKTAGYSGTPLEKKLGIKEGNTIKIVNPPEGYFQLFTETPKNLKEITDPEAKKDFIHFFAESTEDLMGNIKQLHQELKQQGALWISWPKKASKKVTDLNGNVVRSIALENGLVDIKVCAVNEIWSGLKFVIPVKNRT